MNIRKSEPLIKPVSKVVRIQKDKKEKTLIERQLDAATDKGRFIDVQI